MGTAEERVEIKGKRKGHEVKPKRGCIARLVNSPIHTVRKYKEIHVEGRAYRQRAKKSEKKYRL